MREPRRHPKHLAAKFRHYASRISHIPSGGRMPRDLITDARRLIIERMAQMTQDQDQVTVAMLRNVQDYARASGTTIESNDPRPFVVLDAQTSKGADLIAELRRRHDCTPRQLIEPSPGGEPLCHSTNEKPCTKSVRLHQDGAEDPGHE